VARKNKKHVARISKSFQKKGEKRGEENTLTEGKEERAAPAITLSEEKDPQQKPDFFVCRPGKGEKGEQHRDPF